MILAEGIVLVWFGGVLLLGFVAFFVALLAAVVHMARRVLRTAGRIFGLALPTAAREAGARAADRRCARPGCGYLNAGHARFCARCGQPLSG